MESVNCNLCGQNNTREVRFYEEIKTVKCRNCGLIYRNPRLKEDKHWEFYNFYYHTRCEADGRRIFSARMPLFKKLLSQIEKKVKSDSRRVLDIGCGQGHFLRLARESGWLITGVELAKPACDYAKREFNIDVINKTVEGANFKGNFFDVITLWNVLDHMIDPMAVLSESRRILKPDGILLIRAPNVNFHFFLRMVFRQPSVISNYGFSSKAIKHMLEKSGFRNTVCYNSPPTSGDPYGAFARCGPKFAGFVKYAYSIFSALIFYLSFKSLNVGSSLLVYARKPRSEE